jgi:hypothetical protein
VLLYYLLQNPSLCKHETIEAPSGKNKDEERLPLLEGGSTNNRKEEYASNGTTTTTTTTVDDNDIAIPRPALSPRTRIDVQEIERPDDDVFHHAGVVRLEKKQMNYPHGSEPLVRVDEEEAGKDDGREGHLYPSSKRSKLEAPNVGESSSSDTILGKDACLTGFVPLEL